MNNKVKRYVMTFIGVLIVAVAIQFFYAPNNIAAGGISGMAIIINSYFNFIPIGAIMLTFELVLFTIAFIIFGKEFGGISIFASLSLSGSTWILELLFKGVNPVQDDLMLATIFGSLLSGVGLAIVFNENASTGGTDIIAKIVNKYLHLEIGKAVQSVDLFVTIAAAITFGFGKGLYAMLGVIIVGFIIDYVIEGFNKAKFVIIVSEKNEIIRDFIINDVERGCTLIPALGGYKKDEKFLLYAILGRKEFIKIKAFVKENDKYAFISVSDAHEVLGEGFKSVTE